MKKKITMFSSSLAGGGSESVCVSIANSFANKNWQVDLIILNLKNEAYLNRLSNKINLIVLNKNHARYSGLAFLKYFLKYKPGKVITFNYELTVMLVILRFLFRLNLIIIARNPNTLSIKIEKLKDQNFWTKFIVLNLIKYFYHKTDHVVNQCHAMRHDLIKLYPKLHRRTSVIYNPIPLHIKEYIEKKDYILCVARLEKQKGLHNAIKVFSEIADQYPTLRFKIVGQGSLEKQLKKIAFDFSVSSRIDFVGFKKNIIPFYLHAKATILTSAYEGYPNVLIESIALNTPVVSFDCPNGPSEIIKEGVNGYLAKNKDIADFKKKLSFILSNNFETNNLKLSIKNNYIDEILKTYEKLINSFS